MADPIQDRSIAAWVLALRRSSRGDLIAVLAGLAALAVILFVGLPTELRVAPAVPAAVCLIGFAFAAGAIAAARADVSEIPHHLIPASALRLGARIGTMVFLTGGGLVLATGVFRRVTRGIPPGDFSWLGPSLSGTAGVLLALLPTVAAGSLGCLFRLSRAMRPPPGEFGTVASTAPSGRSEPAHRGLLPFALAVFLLSLTSPAVPALLAGRSAPPATVASAAPDNRPTPGPAEEPPPAFRYEAPSGLGIAEASRWRITSTRTIPGLRPDSLAAYSGDSRMLAFATGDGSEVRVFDLVSHALKAEFRTGDPVVRLAWSPDCRSIFCICSSPEAPYRVLNLDRSRSVPLPIRGMFQDCDVRWDSGDEIGFYAGEWRRGVLALDSLGFRSLSPQRAEPNASAEAPASPMIAETERCRLSVQPRIRSFRPPIAYGELSWNFGGDATLCVSDKRTGASFILSGSPVPEGARLLASPDASRIAVVTDGGASLLYVTLADPADGETEADLPSLPDHEADSPLAALLNEGRICAFVCAPLVNPLTGKVVGPDTRSVRALAACPAWDGEARTLAIIESYSPVQAGDVAGCLHYWEQGHPYLLAGDEIEKWWSAVSPPRPAAERASAGILRWNQPDLRAARGGKEFRGWVADTNALPEGAPGFRNVAVLASKPPAPRPETIPVTPAERAVAERIERFVQEHHLKVGRLDLDGFVRDYAGTVDLNDKGAVGGDFIRRDQEDYFARYDRLSETLAGAVAIGTQDGGWRASYTIRSFAVKRKDGREFDRRIRLSLDLREDGRGGFEIFRERAESSN